MINHPHYGDLTLMIHNDTGICTTTKDARIAVAIVEEMGELEAGQQDQPHHIDKCE